MKGATMSEMPAIEDGMIIYDKGHGDEPYGFVCGDIVVYFSQSGLSIKGYNWLSDVTERIKYIWKTQMYGKNLVCDSAIRRVLSGETKPIWSGETVKEMTVEEISKALGYEVKVVKG